MAPAFCVYLMSFVTPGIVIGQSLYAFGAALWVINTECSIAFIVLVPLNYAIAPRLRLAARTASEEE